jgi:hypothetical protein
MADGAEESPGKEALAGGDSGPARALKDAISGSGFVEIALGQTCRKFKIKRNKELQDSASIAGKKLLARVTKGEKGGPETARAALNELVRQLEQALLDSGSMTLSQWSYFSNIMHRHTGVKLDESAADEAGGKDRDEASWKGGQASAKGPASWTWVTQKGALCEVMVDGDWWQAKVRKSHSERGVLVHFLGSSEGENQWVRLEKSRLRPPSADWDKPIRSELGENVEARREADRKAKSSKWTPGKVVELDDDGNRVKASRAPFCCSPESAAAARKSLSLSLSLSPSQSPSLSISQRAGGF